jgi:hypothetical protein
MKITLILLALGLAACATPEKEARTWTTKSPKDAPTGIVAELVDTGGKTACTFNYNYGLLEDVASPRASIYGTQGTVKFLNSTGCSRVITLGPAADDKMSLLGWKSDPAYMLKSGSGPGSVDEFAAMVKKAVAGYTLPQPLIGIGISMGGFNLLKVASAYPKLFKKIVLLNPMLLGPDQWKNEFELDLTKPIGEIDPALMPGNHYTKEEWIYENPEATLERTAELPPVFVTACKQDAFKLGPPTERWVAKARLKGFDVTFNYVDNCEHTKPAFDGVGEFVR